MPGQSETVVAPFAVHDLRRFTNGAYVNPDTTFDSLSGFSFALATRAGELKLGVSQTVGLRS